MDLGRSDAVMGEKKNSLYHPHLMAEAGKSVLKSSQVIPSVIIGCSEQMAESLVTTKWICKSGGGAAWYFNLGLQFIQAERPSAVSDVDSKRT